MSHTEGGPKALPHNFHTGVHPIDSKYLPRPRIDLGLRTRTNLFPIRDILAAVNPPTLIETKTNPFVSQDLPVNIEPAETTSTILETATEKVIASNTQKERTKKATKKKSIGIRLAGKHELIESTPSRIDKLGHKSRAKLFTNIKKYLKYRREGVFPSHWQQFGEKYENEIRWYVQKSVSRVS
ncbi:MAG TPA: hypothetical protein VG917_01820 [Patescibacteria group bacterium]|nr:hypothetical protein [Patescibacteria group bacterium]